MSKLKPCPFCGSNKITTRIFGRDDYRIECQICFASGPSDTTEPKIKNRWNKRTKDEEKAKLKQACDEYKQAALYYVEEIKRLLEARR